MSNRSTSPAALSVVADNGQPTPEAAVKTETVAQRVRRLQNEAKSLAKEHMKGLAAAMVDVEQMAAEIAEGGDAYPPGVRDMARRLVEDMEMKVKTIEAIVARSK